MIGEILKFSIQHRWIMLGLTVLMAGLGAYNLTRLNIDAVPDITNIQVQVSAQARGLSALEIEQRITFPIETGMAGLPRLVKTRSLSQYGIALITVIFEDGTDIYFARRLVSERIQEIKGKLPPAIEPAMGPISTGLGEIFMWTIEALPEAKKPDGTPYSLTDLRTIQEWIIRPQLRNTPGVTEINTIGGYEKQFHVTPDPYKLISHGLTFGDVISALSANNANVGAGYIERSSGQYLVRVPGQVTDLEDIRSITVKSVHSVPVFVRDVATVHFGKELRMGAATKNGEETVLGTVFMLMGENSREVAQRAASKLEEVNRTLPEGVVAKAVYDRTTLVEKTIRTVTKSLAEGAILVVVVLLLFLGNIRAAFITALVIPLSMLFTASGMVVNKLTANLMSLGAIDFGIIVDGAVVIVENCARQLTEMRQELGRPLSQKRTHRCYLGGITRSPKANALRRTDHHYRLSSHIDPDGSRREDVYSDGFDGALGSHWSVDSLIHVRSSGRGFCSCRAKSLTERILSRKTPSTFTVLRYSLLSSIGPLSWSPQWLSWL